MSTPDINRVTVARRAQLEAEHDGPIPAGKIRSAIISEGAVEAGVLLQYLSVTTRLTILSDIQTRILEEERRFVGQPWFIEAVKRLDFAIHELQELVRHG